MSRVAWAISRLSKCDIEVTWSAFARVDPTSDDASPDHSPHCSPSRYDRGRNPNVDPIRRAHDMLLGKSKSALVQTGFKAARRRVGPRTMGSSQEKPRPGRTLHFRSQWT